MPPMIVATAAAAISSSRTPSVTFSSYVPYENDVVVLFSSVSNFATTTLTIPADWSNALGGTTGVSANVSGTVYNHSAVYHSVSNSEMAGGTTTYTVTNLFNATRSGNVCALAIRNVAPSAIVDDADTASNTSSVTPHSLPGLTGANLSNGSLVVSSVMKAATGSYTTPSGWTQQVTSNSSHAKWVGTLDALTSAGTSISSTSITPNSSGGYTAITVAFSFGDISKRVLLNQGVWSSTYY